MKHVFEIFLALGLGVAVTFATLAHAIGPRLPAPALTCFEQSSSITARSDEDRRLFAIHQGGSIQSCHPAGYPDHVRVHRLVTPSSISPRQVCSYRIQPIALRIMDSGERRWASRRNEPPYVGEEDYLFLSKDGLCPPALDSRYTRVQGVYDAVFIRVMQDVAAVLENRSTVSRHRFLDGKGPCASQNYDCLRVVRISQGANLHREKHVDVGLEMDIEGERVHRELRLADGFTGMLR